MLSNNWDLAKSGKLNNSLFLTVPARTCAHLSDTSSRSHRIHRRFQPPLDRLVLPRPKSQPVRVQTSASQSRVPCKAPSPIAQRGRVGCGWCEGSGGGICITLLFRSCLWLPPGLGGRADSGRGVVKGLGSYLIAVRAARRWRSLWGRDTNVLLSLGALWVLRRFP